MEILEKVKELLPKQAISRIELEGSEIIVYTKDREFFKTHELTIKDVVGKIKKRIEVRPESTLAIDQEAATEMIKKMTPEDANIKNIYFEPERSIVVIAAEKPGLVIGRGGELFRQIRSETFWVPRIERVPPIKSEIIAGIRKYVHTEVKFRKEFLNKIGEKIFSEKKQSRDWIRIIPLGGFRQVGRSCVLLETPKSTIMIDCGIAPGATNGDMYPILSTKEFDMTSLDAIILSHSHFDHCGFIPFLYEHGYDGPLYLTTPSLDLMALLTLDFVDVMQKGTTTPLYTAKGVKEAVKHAVTLDWGEVTDVAPDIRLTFANSGHILGSSLIHLHIGEGMHNILYGLDQKYGRSTLLEPADTDFQRVETLLIESTYGGQDNVFPRREEVDMQFMDAIDKTMERGGQVLIPSFAVERSQELMAILNENRFEHPVFLDGMIWDANGIFTAYPEYLSRLMQKRIFNGEDPFKNDIFKRIASSADREKAWTEKPSIIISTSGMLIGGPVIEHLKNMAEDPKNLLMFVSYQGEGSLGRKIQKGWREIPLTDGGKNFTLKMNMEVVTIEGLSGHSDRSQLLNFIRHLSATPDKVIVCHGESHRAAEFARTVDKYFRIDSIAPRNLESIRLK